MVVVATLSLYLPEQKKSMPFCRRRSVWINGRFQKASVKNQCPLHAIDGCWAAEERERQRTPVYCEKWLPPLFVLAFLDLFVFSRTALCFYFLFIALFARLSFCLFVESYAPLIPIYRKRVTFKLYLDTFIELLFCIPLFFLHSRRPQHRLQRAPVVNVGLGSVHHRTDREQ